MNASIFPLPFKAHLIFCIVAFLIFAFQFIRQKKIYQLIMVIAIPVSLLIYAVNSKTWFYSIGIIEAALILLAIISIFIPTKKKEKNGSPTDDNNENGVTGEELPSGSSEEKSEEDQDL